jgi:intracellular sulfur oxidation DsrE/DsrF family protein
VFEKEIASCGFKKVGEVKELLKDNYMVVFEKVEQPAAPPAKAPAGKSPLVAGYGAVVPMPGAPEAPAKGTKAVFDVTATAKDATQPLPGLARAATLLNLAGTCDLKATDLELVIVLHGDATSAALDDGAYKALTGAPHPHADLITKLRAAGVRFLVCGQALARKGYDPKRVRDGVTVAASAVSATINLQARGFAYVPAH